MLSADPIIPVILSSTPTLSAVSELHRAFRAIFGYVKQTHF